MKKINLNTESIEKIERLCALRDELVNGDGLDEFQVEEYEELVNELSHMMPLIS